MTRTVSIGAAICVVATAIWIRVYISAEDALEAGRAARSVGETAVAIENYQYAMRWYSPGARAPRVAADTLWEIAEAERAVGNDEMALRALRELRGAIFATRSLYAPFGDRLDRVNDRIASVTARVHAAYPHARGRSAAELELHHRALLELDPTPSAAWSLVIVLAFVGWLGGMMGAIARGLDASATIQRGPMLRWGGFTLISFAAWIAGLVNA